VPDEKCHAMIEKVRSYAKEAGRNPDAIEIEGRIAYSQGSPDAWRNDFNARKNLGATHVSFNTMCARLKTPSAPIEAIRKFARATIGF
jgi:hypothetical protein